MQKRISVTVQIEDSPELVVYAEVVSADTPEWPMRSAAESVVRVMLKASSIQTATLRHYVGPSLVGETFVRPNDWPTAAAA